MHCIAELVLKVFRSLIIALISLDVCWTISHNAVPFDVTLYHFTPSCVRDLRLHPVWMYAKLFHEKLCHLMLCCINWPNTVPFHLGLPHLTPRWTVSPDSVLFHAQLFHLSLYQWGPPRGGACSLEKIGVSPLFPKNKFGGPTANKLIGRVTGLCLVVIFRIVFWERSDGQQLAI